MAHSIATAPSSHASKSFYLDLRPLIVFVFFFSPSLSLSLSLSLPLSVRSRSVSYHTARRWSNQIDIKCERKHVSPSTLPSCMSKNWGISTSYRQLKHLTVDMKLKCRLLSP